jgi:hypothetical protein
MMNKMFTKLVSLLCMLSLITGAGCMKKEQQTITWDFDDLEGWEYAHQDENPDNQCVLEEGTLRIFTRAHSWDRKKVRTSETFTTGRYTWRTYIPQMGVGDMASVGSWIYCDDHHEIDFEVGYGKDSVRLEAGAAPDEMIAYMTTQDHPNKSVYVAIKSGWHIFEIDLSRVDDNYFVEWIIDDEVVSSVQQTFGTEFAFHIFCSVENLRFIGDHQPENENYGIFDYVKYSYHE